VLQTSILFDEVLPQYGTRHGVLPQTDPAVAVSSPLMWAEALDVMMERLAHSGLDLGRIAAISGSAQQHGSVYLNASAGARLERLDSTRPLVDSVAPMLSRPVAPVWLDSSTSAECQQIAAAVGGQRTLATHTGSRAFERFTAAQIRRFHLMDPEGYAGTDRVHLVSSFLASLLIGRHSPLDPGDGSGMNLMDIASHEWWQPAVDAAAPGLHAKLPSIVPAHAVVGTVSAFWQDRYGLPPAKVVVWSGDNPCSLVGVGLVREGRIAISLGTSDTVFGLMNDPRVDAAGVGHVFGAPTGDFMGLTCFSNGSLARERVRDAYGMTWSDFARALALTPPGNEGRIMLPWFEPEITPFVARPGVRRFGISPDDAAGNVRAVVEAQSMAMALHSRWMSVEVDTIHATGGAAANPGILQVIADVFGADVWRFDVTNSAALGAALRALHADHLHHNDPIEWDDIVSRFVRPLDTIPITPDPRCNEIYRSLTNVYTACERQALSIG
jgi:xylulokinase